MDRSVFISYARSASAPEAQALAKALGGLAFIDTTDIPDGDSFPPHLLKALLASRVVVIFATQTYWERLFCRLEMKLALAGTDLGTSTVMAIGQNADAVINALPEEVALQSSPQAHETARLEALVHKRLQANPAQLGETISRADAERMAKAFLEEAKVPPPLSLQGIVSALPQGVAGQSIGTRFMGRGSDLRRIHRILSAGSSARVTSSIAAGGGFGKTRLAVEYLHRYGPRYYPGGLFWVNASSSSLEDEFWRILYALDPSVPNIAAMRQQQRDIGRDLEQALRKIKEPALYVVDNIPEAAPGDDARSIGDYCPALGVVTVLATSRQDTQEEGVKTISVDTLERDSAVLLLTENLPGFGRLSWADWGKIAEWVGDLPLALDLLNRCLALRSVTPDDLSQQASSASAVGELDTLRKALQGQVPPGAVRGITEALRISFEKLDGRAQAAALLLAHLAPAPIPEAFLDALPEQLRSPQVRAALRSRHFVTGGEGLSFGVMHRLMAEFLRCLNVEESVKLVEIAATAVLGLMPDDRCRDPRDWPNMNLLRPHAEALFDQVAHNPGQIPLTRIATQAALLALEQGDFGKSRRLMQRVLEVRTQLLTPEHPDVLTATNNLAETLRAQGDYVEARKLQEKVLEVSTRVLGREHPDTLAAMVNLANTLSAQGEHAEARKLEEAVVEAVTMLGSDHPFTLAAMNNLAETLRSQGDNAGARKLQEKVLEMRTRALGPEHPDTLTTMNNLAGTLGAQGDHAGARKLQEKVVEACTRVLGPDHPDTLTAMNNLAGSLRSQGDRPGAQKLLEQVVEARTRVLGPEHPGTLVAMWNLGLTLLRLGQSARALQLLRECLANQRKVLGDQHPYTIETASMLKALEEQGKGTAGGH